MALALVPPVPQHSCEPHGQLPVPQGKVALAQVLPPTHLYPARHPVELWSVQPTAQSLPEQGKPLHDLVMGVRHEPAPLQAVLLTVPPEQLAVPHTVVLVG